MFSTRAPFANIPSHPYEADIPPDLREDTVDYFAYGNNMDPTRFSERLGDSALIEYGSVGRLEGYEFGFTKISNATKAPRRGVGNILQQEGASVEGMLWRIKATEKGEDPLRKLDEIECVHKGHYKRETLSIVVDYYNESKNEEVTKIFESVVGYQATEDYTPGQATGEPYDLEPTKDYLNNLLKAADQSGMEACRAQIEQAYEESKRGLKDEDGMVFETFNKGRLKGDENLIRISRKYVQTLTENRKLREMLLRAESVLEQVDALAKSAADRQGAAAAFSAKMAAGGVVTPKKTPRHS